MKFAHETAQRERRNSPLSVKKDEPAPLGTFADSWLTLHHTIGNRATGRFIQAKLKVNEPGDEYEREADRVAEMVMRMPKVKPSITPHPSAVLQRKCAECASGKSLCPKCAEEEEVIQRQASGTSQTGSVGESAFCQTGLDALRGRGRPIPTEAQSFFEPRFGFDFSNVRIHDDHLATRLAHGANALAFTAGKDVVFAAGQYAPSTPQGMNLLAHELAHVVQQDSNARLHGSMIQRKPDPKGAPAAKKPKGPTAADAPKLDVIPSSTDDPCACLVVIHNDERNARKTAQLMHQHCSYNLALVQPDNSKRHIKIPGHSGEIDPNELFPKGTVEECLKDVKSCRDFVNNKSGTTKKAEIGEFVHKQFFLAIGDCSKGFSLPVIALHNNDISDTSEYRKKKDKVGVADLKIDIDKTKAAENEKAVQELKELLSRKFGKGVKKTLTEKKGKTNIFRWCAVSDLSKCHIGDPDHPDNVIWVTNEKDFEALSKKDVNVALQSELPAAKGSEAEKDLSTLFVVLKKLLGDQFAKLMARIGPDLDLEVLEAVVEALATQFRIERLRYLNIETPGVALAAQTDDERVRNYEFIVEALKAVGLHCCGEDPTKAEQNIKEGLKTKEEK